MGSDNDLVQNRRHAIDLKQWWSILSMHTCVTRSHLFGIKPLLEPIICYLSNGLLLTNISEIQIKIQAYSFTKMRLKMWSAKRYLVFPMCCTERVIGSALPELPLRKRDYQRTMPADLKITAGVSEYITQILPAVTGEFSAQMASDAENVSIWWRRHGWSHQVSNHMQQQQILKDV